jgi:hypothetical protein
MRVITKNTLEMKSGFWICGEKRKEARVTQDKNEGENRSQEHGGQL